MLGESGKPSRELDIADIFTNAFRLYFQNFAQFLVPFIIAGAINGAVLVALESVIVVPATLPSMASLQEIMDWLSGFFSAVFTIAFISGIVGWVIGSIVQGIAVKFTSDTVETAQAALLSSFNATVPRLLSLLAVSIITGILIVAGFIAFVIPGIILAIMFSLVVPAIMIEKVGALESLSRSRRLVSGRWLKTFVLLFLFQIVIGLVSSVLSFFMGALGLVGTALSSLLMAFIQPIMPIGLTLYYYSLVARTTTVAPAS